MYSGIKTNKVECSIATPHFVPVLGSENVVQDLTKLTNISAYVLGEKLSKFLGQQIFYLPMLWFIKIFKSH